MIHHGAPPLATMDPRQSEQKRPAYDTQDFTAVILVGAGEKCVSVHAR